jgi:hypothetical protein
VPDTLLHEGRDSSRHVCKDPNGIVKPMWISKTSYLNRFVLFGRTLWRTDYWKRGATSDAARRARHPAAGPPRGAC